MNIAGVLVHARPERIAEVSSALAALPGVEIHAAQPNGKLVVTVDAASDEAQIDRLRGFHDIDGLLSAAVIYHHFEESNVEEASP